ncbi:MAG: hypothetical protein M1819_000414 [Sarea resinae]|nr:MAG: hypothetical protein M1819_000414 [Sarea resinae]
MASLALRTATWMLSLCATGTAAHQLYNEPDPYASIDRSTQARMKLTSGLATAAACTIASGQANNTYSAVTPLVFQPLPLGTIKPQGWLQDQMELMADGLAGHEHDFYLYVANSSWLGGDQEYSPLNEGFPYWFNGLVPLAYGMDDPRLIGQVQSAVDYLLDHQASDGWIGPETTPETRNFWGRYPVFLGLTLLVEADPTQVKTLVPAMHRFVELMHSMLANNYTGYVNQPGDVFDAQWGQARAHDMIISLQWMYENYPMNNSQLLLENMKYLNDKAYDWAWWFSPDVYIKQDLDTVNTTITTDEFPFEHGVNAGQGLKAGAVIRRFTHNDTLLQSTRNGVNWTFQYHGASSGAILGDERIAGLSPMRGSELCTAVEVMYSLSYLYQAMGDNDFADRTELAAFNALPVMLAPDWWSHQYVVEPNQPYSYELSDTPFWNVNHFGQSYGLEPNYPCCTVNHPQGYPKFLAATFVQVGNNGLGHALLSPANVSITLSSGNEVTVSCDTNYPFEHTLIYTISTSAPLEFFVRVPQWATLSGSSITQTSINLTTCSSLSPDPSTGMHAISLPAGSSQILYSLGANISIEPRANDTVAVRYGALLYALEIGEAVTAMPPHSWSDQSVYPSGYAPPQAHDYAINYTSPWALAIDTSTLQLQLSGQANDSQHIQALPNPIFTSGAPPTNITIQACEIDWPYEKGVPADPPPPESRTCTGKPFQATLIPFGAAKLHMAEFPTVDLSKLVDR